MRNSSVRGTRALLASAAIVLVFARAAEAEPLVGGPLPQPVPTSTPTSAPDKVVALGGDLSPLYGRINPFYGDVDAQYGRINPFYGRINPFYGRINPFWSDPTGFWGQINPFAQTTDAATQAFYASSKYDAFWGKDSPYLNKALNYAAQGPFWKGMFAAWTPILAQWNAATTTADASSVAAQIQSQLVAPAVQFWTPLVKAGAGDGAATARMVTSSLAQAGVALNADGSLNADSLLGSTPSQRAMLFLNLYDALMDYSGTGHVDWWMGAVGWTPAMAQIQGGVPSGGVASLSNGVTAQQRPTIGMIDFVIADGKNVSKQVTQYGSTVFSDGHGAAVGSLIIGATDGSKVLGVMPTGSGSVVVYNPYDDTGTTNWDDVGAGVKTLSNLIFKGKTTPMGVINASLGVPGWTLHPGWNDALAGAGAHGHDLVVAAGNDGITQTVNVPWNFAKNPTILIVGSVGADGTISNFSNRPGEACLLPDAGTVCQEANKLKYRFITAPGELILVSDGMGGHMRQSGTSLAAPLVSGAIGLLQNRWPWLANYPDETAGIILKSATPKGDQPGADPVYGVGELNIAASQAPLNWASLTFYQGTSLTSRVTLTLGQVVSQIRSGTQSAWDATGLYFNAFETIGATYRDFQIPLSSKLVGQNAATAGGAQAYQSYLSAALRAQAGRFSGIGGADARIGGLLTGFSRSSAVPTAAMGGALRVSVTPADVGPAFALRRQRFDTDAVLVTERHAFMFGYGNGAPALDGGAGFVFRSDYDVNRGGANPLLGLATGGAYFGARTSLLPRLTVGFGTTARDQGRNLAAIGVDRAVRGAWFDRYAAQAQTMNVAYTIDRRFAVRASVTHLDERAALLGLQSLDRADLAGGSATGGASLGFDLALGRSLTLSGTGTVARTRASGGQIATRGLLSTAAEIGLAKSRLLSRSDELRLSVATPLHAVGGTLTYSSVGVVDRMTGELGIVTQSVASRSRTPIAGQVMYGAALPGGRGGFSLFGRVDQTSSVVPAGVPLGYTGGAQVRFAL